MFGWAGPLKHFFTLSDREYLLLCPEMAQEWGLLHLVYSHGCGEAAEWLLQDYIHEPPGADFAEWAALQILRRGWQNIPKLYLVPTGEVIGYVVKLPPQLGEQEWQEAAYWELDAVLGERGLAADSFQVSTSLVAGKDNCAFVAAVRKEYLQEVQADMAAAELTLADVLLAGSGGTLTAAKGSWRYAEAQPAGAAAEALGQVMPVFMRYVTCQEECLPGLWGRQRERLCWPRLAAVYLLLLLTLGGMILAVDVYHYQRAVHEQAYYQAELEALTGEAQDMNSWQAGRQKLARREKLLEKLAGEDTAWYPLLVQLGLKTVEGVYITELSSGDGNCLYLRGRALSYEFLADFVAALEGDRELFPGGVKLEEAGTMPKTDMLPRWGIDFKLRIDRGAKKDEGKMAADT